MTTKEYLSKHDREIAEIRAIQKHTDETIEKLTSAYARDKDEIWDLLQMLVKGTAAAQEATRDLRADLTRMETGMVELQSGLRVVRESMREQSRRTWEAIQELATAQKATQATLKAFIESLRRGSNGHRKR